MNTSPRRFKRGDTSLERPGMVFLRYGRTKKFGWREEWVTPKRLKEFTRVQYAKADEWRQTDAGKASQRASGKKQRESGYAAHYMATYRMVWQRRPANRLAHNCRSRMRSALKLQGVKKNGKTEKMLGCSFQFFREWIEGQFTELMNLENYGTFWNVDHRIPVSAYDLTNPYELAACFHYTNCQPMWKSENHSKNDRIPGTDKNGRSVSKKIPLAQRIS